MNVQPGDLIFYLDDGTFSHHFFTLIQNFFKETGGSKKAFTHVAMIANDPDLVVEMRWPRPQFRFWADDTRAKVVMRPQVDPKLIQRAIVWCYLNIGDHYSFWNMAMGQFGLTKISDKYCSGWLNYAFRQCGVEFTDADDVVVSPDELSTSKLLAMVGGSNA